MTKETSVDLLRRIKGKSKREVETIKAEYSGSVKIHDKIKPVFVAVRKPVPAPVAPGISTLAGESAMYIHSRRRE
jgi:hypothetical protein